MIKKLILASILSIPLLACSTISGGVVKMNDAFLNDLQGVMNTAGPDIDNAEATAMVVLPSTGLPANANLGKCLASIKTVQVDVSAILAAAGKGTNGAITAGALAETFIPNGPLYNQEKKVLLNGCLDAAMDVLQSQGQLATLATASGLVISQLAVIAPVLAPMIP